LLTHLTAVIDFAHYILYFWKPDKETVYST